MTRHTILFLAANPSGTDPRALGQEARSIQEELERSGHRDSFAFETRWATRPLDVLRELRRLRPTVVHFSGHGGKDGVCFEAADGRAQLVSTAALAETFGAVGASVRLVVLSACYSEAQAEALLAHVDCVVGLRGSTRCEVARAFALGFYGGMGERESIAAAHRQGRAAISLEGLTDRDQPQLLVRGGVDPATLVLAGLAGTSLTTLPPASASAPRIELPESLRGRTRYASAHDASSRSGSEPSALELAREMYARLLAGYSEDTILSAGVLAEAALRHALRLPTSTATSLEQLLGEAGRAAPAVLESNELEGLAWLSRLHAEVTRAPGALRGERIEDADRAAELAIQAAVRCGLMDELAVHDARRAAEWQASEPASTALLRLDRAEQRRSLDDLLALPRRVLVLMVHGEVGQGHDHFGEVVSWRTRAVVKGRWRQLQVEWPAPSPSPDTRLGFLLESLASSLEAPFAPPPVPPAGAGERAWIEALGAVYAALARSRDRLFVHHLLGWLDAGDHELVTRYLRIVWSPLAAHRGEQLVCCLELRRAERTGLPLSRAWRTARAEEKIARAIEKVLEEHAMPGGGHSESLPELTSAGPEDLVDWLRAERQLARPAAIAEAEQLVTMTRGGRFDLVIQRLASLNLDSRSPRR